MTLDTTRKLLSSVDRGRVAAGGRDIGGLLATARTVQALVGPRGLLVGWPPRARALLAALRAHEATLPAW